MAKEKLQNTKTYKSFSEKYGHIEFYPDIPQVSFKEIVGRILIMRDAKILENFKGEFGIHDAALMLMENPDKSDEIFTTICSGEVVVNRVKNAIKDKALPLMAMPQEIESNNGRKYYSIE